MPERRTAAQPKARTRSRRRPPPPRLAQPRAPFYRAAASARLGPAHAAPIRRAAALLGVAEAAGTRSHGERRQQRRGGRRLGREAVGEPLLEGRNDRPGHVWSRQQGHRHQGSPLPTSLS